MLDVLMNNAGVGQVGDIARTEPEDFDRVLEVNVKSIYLVTRALFPPLLASHGSIVNIGSVAEMWFMSDSLLTIDGGWTAAWFRRRRTTS